MADLEAVLADVSYLMAMEKSKNTPAARASKKIVLPDPSVRSVMVRYLEKVGEIDFDSIFHQKLGFLMFKEFCESSSLDESVPQLKFYEETKRYESLDTIEERLVLLPPSPSPSVLTHACLPCRQKAARDIYDNYVMKELLSHTHHYSKDAVDHVQKHLMKNEVPVNLFQPYIQEIFSHLRGDIFQKFVERSVRDVSTSLETDGDPDSRLSSDKFTRFCQWKNLELNIQLTMNDFSVHRIIGRGGFGEVYGCRKADTGKM